MSVSNGDAYQTVGKPCSKHLKEWESHGRWSVSSLSGLLVEPAAKVAPFVWSKFEC